MAATTDDMSLHESLKRAKTSNDSTSTDVLAFTTKLKQVQAINLSQVIAERDALLMEREDLKIKIQTMQMYMKDLLRSQIKEVMNVKDQMDLMASEFTFQFNELARSIERVCLFVQLLYKYYKLNEIVAQSTYRRRTATRRRPT
jgi:hypothetical protein